MGPLPSLRYASEFGAGLSGMISWSFCPSLYTESPFSPVGISLFPLLRPLLRGAIYPTAKGDPPLSLIPARRAGGKLETGCTSLLEIILISPLAHVLSSYYDENPRSVLNQIYHATMQFLTRFLRWALDKVCLTVHISVEVFTAGIFLFLPCTPTKV